MIGLQLLALFMLIPITVCLLVLLQMYIEHWIYATIWAVCVLSFGGLLGVATQSFDAMLVSFILLQFFFGYTYFVYKRRMNQPFSSGTWALRGHYHNKSDKIALKFYISLGLLTLIKHFPHWMTRHSPLVKTLDMSFSKIIESIIENSAGLNLDIKDKDVELYAEIPQIKNKENL